jgi:hypothetical protein
MALVSENWYIRLPDGRVVLAKSTRAVRHHLQTGRIPANSKVRRNSAEDWQQLDGIPEFAKVLEQPASRDMPLPEERDGAAADREIRALGSGQLVNELFNAVDSSLNRYKLWVAGAASLIWAVGVLGLDLLPRLADGPGSWVFRAVIALLLLFALGLATVVLGQMTLVEMSRFRQARWSEVRPGLIGKALRIMAGEGVILGLVLVPMLLLRHMQPSWFGLEEWPQSVQGMILALRLFLEIIFWPLAVMSLLLGPLLLVEECSLPSGLAQWWDMLWSDLGRIFLYETLAAALGMVLTFPLTLPILYASWTYGPFGGNFLSAVGLATLHVLGGLAITPLVAFMLVANVFIYLNLRYEFLFPSTRT